MSPGEAGARRLHGVLAAALLLALAASPWIVMVRQWPRHPAPGDWLHLGLGLLLAAAGLALALSGARRGRWSLWLPLGAAGRARLAREGRGLLRGRWPAAESGGLFALLQGLLLLALLATAATGLLWWAAAGSNGALALAELHGHLAWATAVLLGLHALAVAAHLRDFF